jgi:AcrR family transcriptional regulator
MSRPREFDIDEALDRAVDVFWQYGFEGTSISQLTEAMGISRPSLYAAFGDKKQLFERAIQRYDAGAPAEKLIALELPTVRDAVSTFLHLSADAVTKPEHPHGCLIIQGATRCAPENSDMAAYVAALRSGGLLVLRERFERGVREGDPTATFDPEQLAILVATINEGFAARAADGISREQLHEVVDLTVSALFPRALQPA